MKGRAPNAAAPIALRPPDGTDLSDEPIFVVGTGRCGSTFIQTTLSGTGNVWVWGEHAGMLRGLLQWSQATRDNPLMQRFVFPFAADDAQALLSERRNQPGWEPSWLNSIAPADFDDFERLAIRHFLARRLPPGKTRWGFKEIRYGEDDGVLERLLALFPRARLVHVVRHPIDTVESMLSSWKPEDLARAAAGKSSETAMQRYHQGVQRWVRVTRRLLALAQEHPAARSFRIEDGEAMLDQLAEFLQLDPGSLHEAACRSGIRYGRVRSPAEIAADPAEHLLRQGRAAHGDIAAPLAARLGYKLSVSPRQGNWRPLNSNAAAR